MPDTGSRGTLVPVGSSLTDEVYGPDADHAKDATQGRDGIPSAQLIVSCIARFQGLESQKPYIKSSRSRAKLSSGKSLNHRQMKKAYQAPLPGQRPKSSDCIREPVLPVYALRCNSWQRSREPMDQWRQTGEVSRLESLTLHVSIVKARASSHSGIDLQRQS